MKMMDLGGQYLRLKNEIDTAVQDVCKNASFINGAAVQTFCERLATYMNVPHVISCGNGTDALRIALQALGIGTEDDVIVPAFTYIAPVESIAAVGASPILVDVDPKTFNLNPYLLERSITNRTKAIIAVHLFGQACDMEAILKIATKYNLFVIEDNAQSLGAEYIFNDKHKQKLGTIGHIGTTSFFPTKPLACYGDGGALFTSDDKLAERIKMLANHGQSEKYHHKLIGCNSRLDTIQAAILNVKLNYFNSFTERRQQLAARYDQTLKSCPELVLPERAEYSTHIYHQYTLRVQSGKRNAMKNFLAEKGIPSMIYYPLPVQEQNGYKWVARVMGNLSEAIRLCHEVISIPIDPEMTDEEQTSIIETIGDFFYNK